MNIHSFAMIFNVRRGEKEKKRKGNKCIDRMASHHSPKR